jgi:hypothetical protein
MPPSAVKITANKCIQWFYGPQMSLSNSVYSVGNKTWFSIYEKCEKHVKYPGLTIEKLIEGLDNVPEMKKEILDLLQNCGRITEVLLMHSAFINTYGLHYAKNPLINLNALYELYDFFYENIEFILEDVDNMDIFVKPEVFRDLKNNKMSRPANLAFINKIEDVDETIVLKTKEAFFAFHPVPKKLRICTLKSPTVEITPFDKVDNDIFKPVADAFKCIYKNLKQKIKDSYLNKQAIQYQGLFATSQTYISKPILIYDEPNTFLSQFIEKLIPPLYKQAVIKANTTDPADIIDVAYANLALQDIDYLKELPVSIFTTKIIVYDNVSHAFPIGYINKNLKIGNQKHIISYYKTVINQLFTLGVFKKMDKTSERYVINTEFDLNLLECVKRLPETEEKKTLLIKIREAFFMYVGNLIYFALANKFELPFKISRIYILVLLGGFNKLENNSDDVPLETKLIVSCIYLIEKASPQFLKTVINIIENPEKYKSIKMNSFLKIVDKDYQIYDKNNKYYVNNLIEFIYMNAYNEYIEQKPEIKMFYKGLVETRSYKESDYNFIGKNLMENDFETNLRTLNIVDAVLHRI